MKRSHAIEIARVNLPSSEKRRKKKKPLQLTFPEVEAHLRTSAKHPVRADRSAYCPSGQHKDKA
jgi:hypothetical protein